MNEELTYNDEGYAFKLDENLTKWLTEDRPKWSGSVERGLDKKYVILNVIHKHQGHVNNLLFDTKTQSAVMEIPLGETGWCRIDVLRVKNQYEQI